MQTQPNRDVPRKNENLRGMSDGFTPEGLSEPSLFKSKRSAPARNQDPLFLFACYLEWHHQRNLTAYQALVAALDDSDKRIRVAAELLLHRGSPRPQGNSRGVLPV
jgi:hypothetical protein